MSTAPLERWGCAKHNEEEAGLSTRPAFALARKATGSRGIIVRRGKQQRDLQVAIDCSQILTVNEPTAPVSRALRPEAAPLSAGRLLVYSKALI